MDVSLKAAIKRDYEAFFASEALYKGLQVPWKRGLILLGVGGAPEPLNVPTLADRNSLQEMARQSESRLSCRTSTSRAYMSSLSAVGHAPSRWSLWQLTPRSDPNGEEYSKYRSAPWRRLKRLTWAGIRQIFSRARAEAPCILILEDLDSLVNEKNRSFFLNEVDGLEDNDGILLVGHGPHWPS